LIKAFDFRIPDEESVSDTDDEDYMGELIGETFKTDKFEYYFPTEGSDTSD
jgi:inositol 1,4,5-triphosphate receptor type 3